MDRDRFADSHAALPAAPLDQLPRGHRRPAGLFRRAVFKRTVLNQLRVESAVGGVVEILEKDPEQIAADRLRLALYRQAYRCRSRRRGLSEAHDGNRQRRDEEGHELSVRVEHTT